MRKRKTGTNYGILIYVFSVNRRCPRRVFSVTVVECVGSVSHGPDQPRTAPSSPPHRLHFPPNCHQLSSCSARLTAGQRLHRLSAILQRTPAKLTDSPQPNFTRLSVTFRSFHTFFFDERRSHKVEKFPHIPPQTRTYGR